MSQRLSPPRDEKSQSTTMRKQPYFSSICICHTLPLAGIALLELNPLCQV